MGSLDRSGCTWGTIISPTQWGFIKDGYAENIVVLSSRGVDPHEDTGPKFGQHQGDWRVLGPTTTRSESLLLIRWKQDGQRRNWGAPKGC